MSRIYVTHEQLEQLVSLTEANEVLCVGQDDTKPDGHITAQVNPRWAGRTYEVTAAGDWITE